VELHGVSVLALTSLIASASSLLYLQSFCKDLLTQFLGFWSFSVSLHDAASNRTLPQVKERPVRKAGNLAALCGLSRKGWSLNFSQRYMPPPPVTGVALLCLYVDEVRTSLEAHAFTACYGDGFALFICR
jgi:hypothetical protein